MSTPTTQMQINTKNEMIRSIATAITEGDVKALMNCKRTNDDWTQTHEEWEAMNMLIDSAIQAVD